MMMCRFSVLSLLGSICTMSAMWFANVVLVAQPDGYASLGVFNAAERWRQLLLFLPASFSPVILTMLSNLHGTKDPDGYRRLFGLNLAVSIAVVVVPSIGIILCASPAMGLFGDEYRDGWMTLVILSASSVQALTNYGSAWYVFERQFAWAVIGAVAIRAKRDTISAEAAEAAVNFGGEELAGREVVAAG